MAAWKPIELSAEICSCGSVFTTGGLVLEAINNSLLPNFRAQIIALLTQEEKQCFSLKRS